MRTRWNIDKQVFINGEPKMNWWSRGCLRNMFYDRKMFILRKSIRFFITFGLSGLFLLSLFIYLGLWHYFQNNYCISSYLEPESMSSKKISPTGCNCRMIFVASCGGLLVVTSFCIFLFDCKGVPVFLCYPRNAIYTVWVLMHWLHWCFFKNLAPFFFYFMRQILIKNL